MVDVVLLPSDVDKKAASVDKKVLPLKQREKRFQVLGFLVTVDAATLQEIADQLKITKKNAEGILNHNSHYFESFRIPYENRYWWRVTEKGKQDYFAIANLDQTVSELKLEEAEDAEKAEKRRKFEWLEQKRKMLNKTAKAEKKKAQKKKQEKCGIKEKTVIRGISLFAHFKILNVLATGNYMTHHEVMTVSGLSKMHSFGVLKSLSNSRYVEKVLYNGRCYYWRITDSGRQEYSRLEQIHDPVSITLSTQEIENRDVLVQQNLSKMKIREQEGKIKDSFAAEKKIRANESGLRKYFLYDENNPIDMEIAKRVNKHPRPEYHCKKILCRRLALGCGANYRNINEKIEIKLLDRCKNKGITRNEFVRQLFCAHFNIKMEEVNRPHNHILNSFCVL